MSAEVAILNKHHFRDPVATLRHLADEIERGEHGEIRVVAVAVLHRYEKKGPQLTTFGCGAEASAELATLVFYEGFEATRKMVMGS